MESGYASAVLTILICVVAILENAFVILTVWGIRNLRKKNCTLIVNLAVADLLCGSGNLLIISIIGNDFTADVLDIYAMSVLTIMMWSSSFTFAVGFERMLAVATPIWYNNNITKCKVAIVCVILWTLPPCVFFLTGFLDNWKVFAGFFLYLQFAMTISVGILYVIIFFILKNTNNRHTLGASSRAIRQAQLRSIFITFGILICSLSLCLLPVQVLAICRFNECVDWSEHIWQTIFGVMLPILMFNSALNPIVYWWRIPTFREGYKNLVISWLVRCHIRQKDRPKSPQWNGQYQTTRQ
ncbi:mas-related G-protein coupled receptor member X1-like [Anneissia japonica]|uniref:mas-related G-protein coupled receptor member X1-like n=1 Tax=Anneissia japonica TaxID=1529436 RepID=UPI0014259C46|nr:mas-related G-protein coupled receptor member X1-like [Anneissia japonica]